MCWLVSVVLVTSAYIKTLCQQCLLIDVVCGGDEELDAVQARGDPCPGARPQGVEA